MCRVPAQMIGHKSRDEVVTMVVTGLPTQVERNVRFVAGGLQQFRAKLLGEKRIGVANINQELRIAGTILDQRNRIMAAPALFVGAEVTAQRLDSPRHL